MYGRFSVSDLFGRCYWRTNDLRDCFETAQYIYQTFGRDLLVCRDDTTQRTVYLWNGTVSTYVRDGNLNYLEGVR